MRASSGRIAFAVALLGIAADFAAAQENNPPQGVADIQVAADSVLGDFEKSIQPPPENKKPDEHHATKQRKREHDDGVGDELTEAVVRGMVDLTVDILAVGGRSSLQRVMPGADAPSYRSNGEALIPFVRYDFAYQWVSADITARVNRLEGGFGPVALYLEDYTFNESVPASTLKIKRQMFLYRMSNKDFEVDIGLGQSVIVGAHRTVINAFSLRGRFMLNENTSMEFQPVWGERLNDYELALHYGRQFGALKIGYRNLNGPDSSLSGPFAGLAFYF